MINPKADFFFEKADKWQKEFEQLRKLIDSCGLNEEVKWGVPCYTFEDRNIVLIHGFKEYCAMLFHKGALLSDPEGILIQQTANVQAARQIRFTSLKEIRELAPVLKQYVYEAIEVERAGIAVPYKKAEEFAVAEEFQQQLDSQPKLKKAFEALTPGRQRGYLLFFAAPKQSKTRAARVEKYIPIILGGKGLND
ncbi:DUF1801 domain-containing protein [Chitinophaga sedimenti]|uniref:YdeI/OmpD-associated family protein n=1 Tax=Chitinophaga sedimenti TaxID=2033606 RepID=UPI0020041AB5|nr:DUF1801 domain-containing protein [Chitinophaga sedimenti]MCK7554884.1 DUF1801 domain-containing protein [Chitinophaga sedimenti]